MALLPKSMILRSALNCYKNSGFYATRRSLISKQLVYSQFGDPVNVVKFRETQVPKLKPNEVLVRMLAAPVNPADINTIQGKYPVKVELPCIPGNEGVGLIEDVGAEVSGFSPGYKVIVTKPVQGTWRDLAVFDKSVLKAVPENLGTVEAATLTVNPCTAYRMLMDFVNVRDGKVVIQNGANGACGQNVIQLCKAWNIKNINIVRNRPDIAELKKYLEDLGATYVLTEDELRSTTIFKEKKIEKPILALNCVGGKNSLEMLRHLNHGGKMVTYGGMSREPVNIPTSAFIFKDLSFYGYWMTRWNEKAKQEQKDEMIAEIVSLMCGQLLKGPSHKLVKFDQYEEALKNALRKGPIKPCLPTVAGSEGVGEIVEIGDKVSRRQLGERVLINRKLLGSWRYYGIYDEHFVMPTAKNLPLNEAATLATSPCIAYRMLKDYIKLKPRSCVIQTAANSPVGQYVIQLCRLWGIQTINLLSTPGDDKSMKDHLYKLGATQVCTLQEAEEIPFFNTSIQRPILGINCLDGLDLDMILKALAPNGVVVNYGTASLMPCLKENWRLDAQFCRFDLNEWDEKVAAAHNRVAMLDELSKHMIIGEIIAPSHEVVEIRNYRLALENTARQDACSSKTYVFDFTVP